MEKLHYKISDIDDAYRRWKHFIYYDNNYLLYRQKIAEFECDEQEDLANLPGKSILEKKLNRLLSRLQQDHIDCEDWYKEIKAFPIPKSFKDEETHPKIIHNVVPESINLKNATYLIDCPVELHLISVLWVIQNGLEIQKNYKKDNYGNLLTDDINKSNKRVSLFIPYHICYQKWRDGAISKAKQLVSEDNDVLMFGLDIKDFYHSIRLIEEDYVIAYQKKNNTDTRLGGILHEISKYYFTDNFAEHSNNAGLPIGLVSSSILANQHLVKFDQEVREKIQPYYYGRYVDDMIIVLKCPKKCKNEAEINEQVETYLNLILNKTNEEQELKNSSCHISKEVEETWQLKAITNLKIQGDKLTKYYFDAKEPLVLLEKFMREIRENSSEYRFLPTESVAKMTFEEAAFSIHYEGAKTKLRSIRDFSSNRFGVSSYLAKLIFNAIRVENVKPQKNIKQITTFFRGKRALEMFGLWEKAFTYMVVTDYQKGFKLLEKNIRKAIEQLLVQEEKGAISNIELSLKQHLNAAQQMALALNPTWKGYDIDLSTKFRKSNMVRHAYVSDPMINYLQLDESNEKWSYLKFDWNNISLHDLKKDFNEILRYDSWKFSPRFVHFHEVAIGWINYQLHLQNDGGSISDKYLNDVFSIFYHINYKKPLPSNEQTEESGNEETARDLYFKINIPSISNHIKITEIQTPHNSELKEVNIGLANIEISSSNIKKSYLSKPNLSAARRDEIYAILNQITRQKGADLLVLPEVCVPHNWVALLCERSRKEGMAMVFGLEHLIKNKYAHNMLVTLLPVRVDEKSEEGLETTPPEIKAVIPIFRLKNHYSPGERKELEGHHYLIPESSEAHYHLFNWKGLRFTTFNCFELADINHRGAFRSHIDMLVACEVNRDVPYFSNIAEATSRDLHCYFVQANTSEFGDSRIVKPVKSEVKDVLRIKGGKNPTVLVQSVDLELLREFQYKHWNLQLDDKNFKPTPPGYDRKLVAKRAQLKFPK